MLEDEAEGGTRQDKGWWVVGGVVQGEGLMCITRGRRQKKEGVTFLSIQLPLGGVGFKCHFTLTSKSM